MEALGVGVVEALPAVCARRRATNRLRATTNPRALPLTQAIAAATADRREFVAALEAEAKATDELCEAEEAEEALRHLRAKGSRDASLSLDSEGATPENR